MNKRIVTTPNFQEINQLHSHYSMLDKVSRSSDLRSEYQRLERMAYNFGMHIQSKGGDITLEERAQARHLLDMMNAVQSEGVEVSRDFSIEMQKELAKVFPLS